MAGMTLRSAEITMLEQTRTNVMARPMPNAPETVVVITRIMLKKMVANVAICVLIILRHPPSAHL